MAKLARSCDDAEADAARRVGGARCRTRARATSRGSFANPRPAPKPTEAVDADDAARQVGSTPPSARISLSLVSPSSRARPATRRWSRARRAGQGRGTPERASRASRTRAGSPRVERHVGGAAGSNDEFEATAVRSRVLRFKFWRTARARRRRRRGRASRPGTPRSFSPSTPSDAFAFDVDVGIQLAAGPAIASTTAALVLARAVAAAPAGAVAIVVTDHRRRRLRREVAPARSTFGRRHLERWATSGAPGRGTPPTRVTCVVRRKVRINEARSDARA